MTIQKTKLNGKKVCIKIMREMANTWGLWVIGQECAWSFSVNWEKMDEYYYC